MKRNEIRAKVKYDWSDKRCKFYPGDNVVVVCTDVHQRKFLEMEGTVFAVTVTDSGNIRGQNEGCRLSRTYTRYYVEFEDGECNRFHSHYLAKV